MNKRVLVGHSAGLGLALVELLVVIGIIATLLAILMPALNAARTRARRPVCAAYLRGIGESVLMYAGENKGAIPTVSDNQTVNYRGNTVDIAFGDQWPNMSLNFSYVGGDFYW